MLGFQNRMSTRASTNLINRSMISCFFVILTHLALSMVPRLVPTYSLLSLLPVSALVLLVLSGLGKLCRRLLGVYASAPAFVFFNILFIWGVYVAVVRQAILPLMDFVMNGELVMLITGWYCILSSNPGLVEHGSSHKNTSIEDSGAEVEDQCKELEPCAGVHSECLTIESFVSDTRIRYCKSCRAYIRGFDHHCPAFGNCVGYKNHILFMVLLVGFLITETSYVVCCSQFAAESSILDHKRQENNLSNNLVFSTMLFSILQVLWQGLFLAWHIYCVCANIRTDEWINWRNYPEFRVVQPQPGQTFTEVRFRNPYDKGVIGNIKEFLAPE